MKPEELSDAIGLIDEETVAEAEELRERMPEARRKPKKHAIRWVCLGAAACLCVVLAGLWQGGWRSVSAPEEDGQSGGTGTESAGSDGEAAEEQIESDEKTSELLSDDGTGTDSGSAALAAAVYPEELAYPGEEDSDTWSEWWEQVRAKRQLDVETDGLTAFFTESAQIYLSDSEGENRIYSPLNLYFVLGMLAEVTDGSTQAQLLSALGMEDLETLRTQVSSLWNQNYQDDGLVTSIFANSLWLDSGLSYNTETLGNLAEYYYASSYSGVMGEEAYSALLRQWVSEQTGGLLDENLETLSLDTGTVLELLSTSLFESGWYTGFNANENTAGTFYGADGETEVIYMNRTEEGGALHLGENFTAVGLSLQNDGAMWFILPDEESSVEEVLASGLEMILSYSLEGVEPDGLTVTSASLHMSIPKFDITSQLDLLDGLEAMGLTELTDSSLADFSALLDSADSGELLLTGAQQATRVLIDEDGVTAASYASAEVLLTAIPGEQEEVYFIVDRPFLFVITGASGVPLYIGVVNQIAE